MYGMVSLRYPFSMVNAYEYSGAYCTMTIISLLALPLELPPNAPARASGFTSFLDGLPEYLSRCTISCLSPMRCELIRETRPDIRRWCIWCSTDRSSWRICILCTCMLVHSRTPTRKDSEVRCYLLLPKKNGSLINQRHLNLPLLISWLSARQYAPEGGFSGRTNKLVDGCYSHWVGGCWPLVEAALNGPQTSTSIRKAKISSLYSKEGLTRYMLSCCQEDSGGLRDKPSA